MSSSHKEIPPEKFYGGVTAKQEKIDAILKKQGEAKVMTPKFMNNLLGPSKTWKVFKKQQEAIDCCLLRRNGLMCFAFEDFNGTRMFLVAHPKVFWSFNSHRFFKSCSTYEIIQEYSACKLYLDIEYEYAYNSNCNGDRMLNNLLKIININLKENFKIHCTDNDILDLDSSSGTKFSHHIIYQIRNTAFQDNYAVGSFIKKVFGELKEAHKSGSSDDNEKLTEIAKKYGLTLDNLLELFIYDNKNKTKLFIDEGVYTKNRHFRLLGSSKLSKNIPLVISKNNRYKPKESAELYDLSMFLDSLITYFSWNVDRVLEVEESEKSKKRKIYVGRGTETEVKPTEFSLYPQIDSFINNLISPNGRIRRKVFFSDSSTIVYDIQGFRYCDHINREHKSNNIKFIIDLQCLGFYQKCYDPDCVDFRSDLKPLPDEIKFLFEDDAFLANDIVSCDFSDFSDEFFLKAIENLGKDDFELDNSITDEDLGRVADCAEAMLEVVW